MKILNIKRNKKGQFIRVWDKHRIKRKCLECGKEFETIESRIKVGKGKYCSKKCFRKNFPSEETKEKIRKTNRGKHFSLKTEFKKGSNLEEKNNKWMGDNVGYMGIHLWLRSRYGDADRCENRENNILNFKCKRITNNYNWALIKGKKYERKRENFMMLCCSCHLKYDREKSN